jgi:hypothetical protein
MVITQEDAFFSMNRGTVVVSHGEAKNAKLMES